MKCFPPWKFHSTHSENTSKLAHFLSCSTKKKKKKIFAVIISYWFPDAGLSLSRYSGKEKAKGKENKQQTLILSLIATLAGGVSLPTVCQSLQLGKMRTEAAARSPQQALALRGQAGLPSGQRRHLHPGRQPRRRVGKPPAAFKPAPARGRGLGGARGLRGPDGAGDPGGSAPCGKGRVPGARACLFKCQGLRSRPGSPEPDLQSGPSRSGACCSQGPSGSCHRRAG